jgi:hypothetical protein
MFNEPKMPEEKNNSLETEKASDDNSKEKELTPEEKLEAVELGVGGKAEEIKAQIENDSNLSPEAKKTKLEMLVQAAEKTVEFAKALWSKHDSVKYSALTIFGAVLLQAGWDIYHGGKTSMELADFCAGYMGFYFCGTGAALLSINTIVEAKKRLGKHKSLE